MHDKSEQKLVILCHFLKWKLFVRPACKPSTWNTVICNLPPVRKRGWVRRGFSRSKTDRTRIRHRDRNTMLCANWTPCRFCRSRSSSSSSIRDRRTVNSPQWRWSVSQLWPLTPDQPRPQQRGCREQTVLWIFLFSSLSTATPQRGRLSITDWRSCGS